MTSFKLGATSIGATRVAVCGGVLFAVCLVIYWPAIANDFVMFDDDINIYQNPHLGYPSWSRIGWIFSDVSYVRRYMPIGWLSYSIVTLFKGFSPSGFHAAGVFVHGLNCVLLFVLLVRFIGRIGAGQLTRGGVLLAAAASLWWAINPLRVEIVAWASGLHYSIATAFCLMALISYIESSRFDGTGSGKAWGISSAILFLLSLLSYPALIGAVGCVFAFELYIAGLLAQGFDGCRRRCLDIVTGRFALWLTVGIVLLAINVIANLTADSRWNSGINISFLAKIANLAYFLGYYVPKVFWPKDLCPVYDTLMFPGFKSTEFICTSCAAIIYVGALSWCAFRRSASGLICATIAYVSILVPMSGILEPLQFTADRYSNAPSLICSVVIVILGCQLKAKRACYWVAAIVSVWSLAWTLDVRRQLRVWENTETLVTRILTVIKRPSYMRTAMVVRLATYRCFYRGDTAGASAVIEGESACPYGPAEFETLTRLRLSISSSKGWGPEFVSHPAVGLAKLAIDHDLAANDIRTARMRLLEAIRWAPNFWQARLQLAAVLLMQGELDESYEQYRAAIVIPGASIREQDRQTYLESLSAARARAATK